jgi:hypothetical protein
MLRFYGLIEKEKSLSLTGMGKAMTCPCPIGGLA